MGKTIRPGTQIVDYWPDDGEYVFYLEGSFQFSDIIERATEKWGHLEGFSFDNIVIGSEYIHTRCLYYDCFDSSDWTDFLVIEYLQP